MALRRPNTLLILWRFLNHIISYFVLFVYDHLSISFVACKKVFAQSNPSYDYIIYCCQTFSIKSDFLTRKSFLFSRIFEICKTHWVRKIMIYTCFSGQMATIIICQRFLLRTSLNNNAATYIIISIILIAIVQIKNFYF